MQDPKTRFLAYLLLKMLQIHSIQAFADSIIRYMKVYASYEIVFRGLENMKGRMYRDAVELLKLFSFLHHEHVHYDILIAAVTHPRI